MATVPTIEDTGDDATLYEVSGDGVATEAGTAPRYGTWSIGGRLVAYAEWDSNGGLLPGFGPELLLRGRSGRPTALTPPSDAPAAGDVTGVLPVGWETDDRFAAVVLYDEGRGLRQAVWHCDADPLRCETVVDDLPPAPETGWPDLPVKP